MKTRKEIKMEMRKNTFEALVEIIAEMERTGKYYTLDELSTMTNGYLSPQEISSFISQNVSKNRYGERRVSCIANGTTEQIFRFGSIEQLRNFDEYIVPYSKTFNKDKATVGRIHKRYVNIDDPNDIIEINRTIRKTTYALR